MTPMHSPTADGLPIGAARAVRRVSGAFLLRVLLLLLTIAVAGVYSYNRIVRPASLQGVVNAPLVTLRAPIDGKLVRGGLAIGQSIVAGAELFAVRDPRVDRHREQDLRARLSAARERAVALDRIAIGLEAMSADLLRRANAYAGAEEARLRATVKGQEIAIVNAAQTYAYARQQEDRAHRLVRAGTAVKQRLEDAIRTRLAARAALDRAVAERQASLTALEAAKQQIFVQAGYGGAAYAQQKQDEIQVRLADTRYLHAATAAEIASLEEALTAETAHVEALREVAVPSAAGGIVTAVYVSPGTDVLRGNPLADVMDCTSLYVEATVAPGWFATPRAGDAVRVELYGSGLALDGKIRALRDTAMALDPSRAIPLADRDNRQTLTAIVDIDAASLAAGGRCPAGQPAIVRFH